MPIDVPPSPDPRAGFPTTGLLDDRAVLEACVEANRAEVAALLEGMGEEEARARLVPSLTTLLGLVKHATFVERVWFGVHLSRRSRAEVGVPETVDESFALEADDTVASVLAGHARAVAASREVAAGLAWDHVVDHPHLGEVTLRWVHVHLVQELARHAGHGDVLREQLLAARSSPA